MERTKTESASNEFDIEPRVAVDRHLSPARLRWGERPMWGWESGRVLVAVFAHPEGRRDARRQPHPLRKAVEPICVGLRQFVTELSAGFTINIDASERHPPRRRHVEYHAREGYPRVGSVGWRRRGASTGRRRTGRCRAREWATAITCPGHNGEADSEREALHVVPYVYRPHRGKTPQRRIPNRP